MRTLHQSPYSRLGGSGVSIAQGVPNVHSVFVPQREEQGKEPGRTADATGRLSNMLL